MPASSLPVTDMMAAMAAMPSESAPNFGHLLSTGAIRLVDELFVEIHTDINSCCYPPWDEGRHWADALRLIRLLRTSGVFAHMWG